ncbi:phosphatase PAP2 family protein [Sphingobium sp. B11D3D]|uniref:phosphatase PAP2 family protein n=1 Tax=Sphingobium sp. B11D3D TaxID=2940576 RepID=UPI0022240F44|nr:phosphatase PAP2 family protein [Sphingobium sp. B11D3D]MCW2371023.1 undecaprenyl-diphosphatase [Sphingobium sp. B11D3D]
MRQPPTPGVALSFALGLALLVAAIGFLQPTGLFAPIDERLMALAGKLHGVRGAGLVTHGAVALDRLGAVGGRTLIVLAVGLVFIKLGHPERLIPLLVAGVGTALVIGVVKLGFNAPRPMMLSPDMLPCLVETVGTSFPSGHAAGAMALYGAIALLARSRVVTWVCAAMILATGASRVWLGVHWPSDVAGGWAVGLIWLLLVFFILPWWRPLLQRPVISRD